MSKAKSDNSQLADRRLKPLDPYSSTSTIPHPTPESQEKRVENSEINIADYWNNATVMGTYKDIINNRVQTKTAPTKVESVNIESTAVNDSNIKTGKALIEKLNNAMPEIRDMQAVAKLTGHEFPKGKIDLVTQVGNYFKSLGKRLQEKVSGIL